MYLPVDSGMVHSLDKWSNRQLIAPVGNHLTAESQHHSDGIQKLNFLHFTCGEGGGAHEVGG